MPYERSVGFAVLLPSTITLASPRKRGGGTADIIFWLAVQYSDSPAFTILKLFRAVTVGIVNASEAFMLALLSISISFDPHQPSQNRTIPRKLPTPSPYERSVCFASCKTLGVQLRASMPLYERSVCFASLRNSGRSTSGIHTRPLSKVRCCRPKKFGRLPEGLFRHFSSRTNPSKTSLSHSPFVGERACSSRCIEPLYPHNHRKRTIIHSPHTNPSKTALSLEKHYHTCLPCQREVD